MSHARLGVQKTYKLYIGGDFVRSESGRYDPVYAPAPGRRSRVAGRESRAFLANVSRASRKDLRDAVRKAREAFPGWSGKSAYNRGQILYRMAEMLEARRADFFELMHTAHPLPKREIEAALDRMIDRLVYYAGWSDKFTSVLGTVNPVASSYFDFSIPEPTGVVGIVAPETPALLGLVTLLAPVIVSGNCAVCLVSEKYPIASLEFAEILATSDPPSGVVNLLSGRKEDLVPHLARHMDVNAIANADTNPTVRKVIDEDAAVNVKRICHYPLSTADYHDDQKSQGLDMIEAFVEIKTTWHPIGV